MGAEGPEGPTSQEARVRKLPTMTGASLVSFKAFHGPYKALQGPKVPKSFIGVWGPFLFFLVAAMRKTACGVAQIAKTRG